MKNLTKKILILGLLFNFSNVVNALTCNIDKVISSTKIVKGNTCDCVDDSLMKHTGAYDNVTENNGQFTAICKATK